MRWTILGSGGCTVIPKPLCRCTVCSEARRKGRPYERTGPSAFIHDENILIDTPAEICSQLNRSGIERVERLMFTHLDPDHAEGFRVVEQISLDFRSWKAYPKKRIELVVPADLYRRLKNLHSAYGPLIDFYESQGYIRAAPFDKSARIGEMDITALPVKSGDPVSFVYVFEKGGRRIVYAPCDMKPFPESREEVREPDLLIIQPGIFEDGLKHDFVYPKEHISRSTLYTFEQTMELGRRIGAGRILFVHLEEYWNRGYDEYLALERKYDHVSFAHDGMEVEV